MYSRNSPTPMMPLACASLRSLATFRAAQMGHLDALSARLLQVGGLPPLRRSLERQRPSGAPVFAPGRGPRRQEPDATPRQQVSCPQTDPVWKALDSRTGALEQAEEG